MEYPLIPMSEIRDEPRKIAVAWHENATNWIGDKHKLASDIQNYADQCSIPSCIEFPDGMQFKLNELFDFSVDQLKELNLIFKKGDTVLRFALKEVKK